MTQQRATSFGSVSGLYERSRPGYPAGAVADLLGPEPLDVLDVGAGTGKLTRALVAHGHRVTAVDPSPEMLAELTRAVPGVPAELGAAEHLPVADGSFDAVVAAQAYHWFDPAATPPELARVLRPDGLLGLLWNFRDDHVPWVSRFGDLVGREDAGDLMSAPALGPHFTAAQVRRYGHTTELTVDGLVELAASRSSVIVLPEQARVARLALVRTLGDEVAAGGVVVVPYQLQVWSARRLG